MLYHLLYNLRDHFSWLNVFKYITFRAMFAFLLTFIITMVGQPIFIRKLLSRGIKGQPIRDDGPKDHEVKKGTPRWVGSL